MGAGGSDSNPQTQARTDQSGEEGDDEVFQDQDDDQSDGAKKAVTYSRDMGVRRISSDEDGKDREARKSFKTNRSGSTPNPKRSVSRKRKSDDEGNDNDV